MTMRGVLIIVMCIINIFYNIIVKFLTDAAKTSIIK